MLNMLLVNKDWTLSIHAKNDQANLFKKHIGLCYENILYRLTFDIGRRRLNASRFNVTQIERIDW